MKKILLLLFLIFGTIGLYGYKIQLSSHEIHSDSRGEVNNFKKQIQPKTINSQEPATEYPPIEKLRKANLFSTSIDVNNKTFLVYLYSDNQTVKTAAEDTFCSDEGDPIIQGDFSYYLVDEQNRILDVLNLGQFSYNKYYDHIFNFEGLQVFGVTECQGIDHYSNQLFFVKDEKIERVTLRDIYKIDTFSIMKETPDDYIQTVIFIDGGSYWYFTNWKIDNGQLEVVEKKTYSYEKGSRLYEKWIKEKNYVVKIGTNYKLYALWFVLVVIGIFILIKKQLIRKLYNPHLFRWLDLF
ncbi:MAG: hypothetical protein H0Z33_17230 [Bacillaceae bacterium]|nr:hypothetical protein [Bacillaceae bacterium]